MALWLITDTHLGHDNMVRLCGRPSNFSERIVEAWRMRVRDDDTIIHMGDVRFGKGSKQWDWVVGGLPGFKVLIKGNHDKRDNEFYYTVGWGLVTVGVLLPTKWGRVWVSHAPAVQGDPPWWDVNLHGHMHNNRAELPELTHGRRVLMALEDEGYEPRELERFLERRLGA